MNPLQTGYCLQKLALSASGYARNSEYFTAFGSEGYIVKDLNTVLAVKVKSLYHKPVRGIFRLCSVNVKRNLFAHHHFGKLGFVRFLRYNRIYVFAAAENRHAVGNGEHLVHFVRDYYNGFAVAAHSFQHRKELFGLLWGKHSSRLVKYQYIRSAVKHLDYFNGLLFRNRHLINFLLRVNIKPVFLGNIGDALCGFLKIEAFIAVDPQNYIFGSVKYIHKLKMLVDHTYLKVKGILRRVYYNAFAVHKNLALIRVVDTCNHIHERRLARSVFTEHGKNFALFHRKINVFVSDHLTEAFRYISYFKRVHKYPPCML